MLMAHEVGRRLRVAVVGCGNHAYRSIFPCLDYVAVDLVATCDVDRARAQRYADHFGAAHASASLEELIGWGNVEAVLLAVGPEQHPDLTCEALEAGLHVWLEKPPSMSVAEIDRMIRARDASGKNVVVGFKKTFMPGMARMRAFLDDSSFGRLRTLSARIPMDIPIDGAAVLRERRFTDWLGNGVHPLSAMAFLAGRPTSMTVYRSDPPGGFVVFDYPGGAVGSLHMARGHSPSGPMERYEAVCERGHLVLENNSRLTVHRPGYPFDYGRGTDFAAGDENVAALVYEPQNTLSTLENKAIFLQGFVQEIDHFVTSCLNGVVPDRGTLELARIVMECYEAGLLSDRTPVRLDDLPKAT